MNGINRYELARRLGDELEELGGLRSRIWLGDGADRFTPVLSEHAQSSDAYAERTFDELRSSAALGLGASLQPQVGFVEIDGWAMLDAQRRTQATEAIERAAKAMAAASALETAESSGSGTVLVADDDPAIRKLLRTILTRKGYHVLEASDGRDAVEKVRSLHPDLVVMDWEMPNLDGRDAAAALKGARDTNHVPIVMLTSRSRIEDKVDALGVGVQDFITKPFDFREFMARIDQQVRWRRLLDERGEPSGTVSVDLGEAQAPQGAGLDRARACAVRGEHERALAEAMSIAERCEESAAYEEAAQAYALASESAAIVKNPDVANKLQRLSGKMYLMLAEHASETSKIQLGYTMSAKMFLTAGNLKLAKDVAARPVA